MFEKVFLPGLAVFLILATLALATREIVAKRRNRRVYTGRHWRTTEGNYRELLWSDTIGGYIYCATGA